MIKSFPYWLLKGESPVLTFQTNKNGTFDPSLTTLDTSVATWSVEGLGSQTSNNPVFTLDGSLRTVTIEIADFAQINTINWSSQDIVGQLDLQLLTNCVAFNLNFNSNLISILNPVNSENTTTYIANQCNLLNVLDLTSFSNFGGNFSVRDNPNLTGILHSASTNNFTAYRAYNCNLNGTLNISMLSGLGNAFEVYNNPNLTGILNPTSTNIINTYSVYNCNLNGTLDISTLNIANYFRADNNQNLTAILNPTNSNSFVLYFAYNCNLSSWDGSGLTGLSGTLRLRENQNLTNVILPNSAGSFVLIQMYQTGIGVLNWSALTGSVQSIEIHDNQLTSAEADENIVLIDNNVNLTNTLNIAGNNQALTNGSSTGFDGLTAKSNLQGEGVTVLSN